MSSPSSTTTAAALLASQRALLSAAARAIPHRFDSCTYASGPLRQPVHALPGGAGVCAACAVACHAGRAQVELFARRAFTCDCPTPRGGARCTLTPGGVQEDNGANTYGKNFGGVFCRCGREYDPETERETMVQCLACEDWLHESCLHLRDRPPSRAPSPSPPPAPEPLTDEEPSLLSALRGAPPSDDGDSDSDAESDAGALLPASAYDALLCGACVARIPAVWGYAGHAGAPLLVRPRGSAWEVLGDVLPDPEDEEGEVDVEGEGAAVGGKRSAPADDGAPPPKRARTHPSTASPSAAPECTKPTPLPCVSALLARRAAGAGPPAEDDGAAEESACDVFLSPGFRARWCRCPSCLPALSAHPYLLEEERTYEPPPDPDRGRSLEELGMAALAALPRAAALDGVRAFGAMQARLSAFLRPFADAGRVVRAEDVRAFFAAEREGPARGA